METVKYKLIRYNKYSRSGKKLIAVRKIVLHWTANFGGSANGHFNYFNNLSGRYASAHIFVDRNEALCIIPLNEVAYHANDGSYRGISSLKPNANYRSLGVEMCVEKDGSIHPDTIRRTAKVVAELCEKFGLDPIDDIVRHYDITRKNCPAPWVSNPSMLTNFKRLVQAIMKGEEVTPDDNDNYPLLDMGIRSSRVKLFQMYLNDLGYNLTVDGVFGNETKSMVMKFQKDKGLSVDGIVGKNTWGKMNEIISNRYPTLKYDLRSSHVKRFQEIMNKAGYTVQVNSYYSGALTKLIKKIQGENDLEADGIIDYNDWKFFENKAKINEIEKELFRVRKSWDNPDSQIGAFADFNNAKQCADENDGYCVFDSKGNKLYPEDKPVEEPKEPVEEKPEPPVEEKPVDNNKNPIMGKSNISIDKIKAFVESKNPDIDNLHDIIKAFIDVGEVYGVRGDVAVCQSLIETGWFRFDGGTAVTPDQHNYCGLGVVRKGIKGHSFDTIEDGVEAQIQHLFAYASTDDIPDGKDIIDPRFKYVSRGIAPNWEDLNMKWAMNEYYGEHIMKIYNDLIAFEYEKTEDDNSKYDNIEELDNMAKSLLGISEKLTYIVESIKKENDNK